MLIKESTKYILNSTSLLFAPGLVEYARTLQTTTGKGSRNNKRIARQIIGAWNIPERIARRVLDPEYKPEYDHKKGTVVIWD